MPRVWRGQPSTGAHFLKYSYRPNCRGGRVRKVRPGGAGQPQWEPGACSALRQSSTRLPALHSCLCPRHRTLKAPCAE